MTYNTGTEDGSCRLDIDRVRQLDTVLIIDHSIFCKKAIRGKALQELFTGHTVPSRISRFKSYFASERRHTGCESYIPHILHREASASSIQHTHFDVHTEAAPNDVQKSNFVSNGEVFTFDAGMDALDVSCPLVTQCRCLAGIDGHDV